jgi:His-Xaa-Ser system radical SAM maturase HxsC
MLKLYTKEIRPLGKVNGSNFIARLTENTQLPAPLRSNHILLIREQQLTALPIGFRSYFVFRELEAFRELENVFLLPDNQLYLADGDVVRFNPERLALRTIYRKSSKHNSLLVTERCNNFCLMCSQPPKNVDDSYLINELLEAIPLMDRGTEELGITGGEPTLLGNELFKLVRVIKNYLPDTSVHILSNGRKFSDLAFAEKIASVQHEDLMIGIPIYSDISNIHDYVVQADGAFDETIRGIINLKRYKQKVEIRVVIHKQTYERLPQLAEFLARNLLFVDHVALMGLEMMGFTRHNLEDLWIDPMDYQPQLLEAVETLTRYKMSVSIYNC